MLENPLYIGERIIDYADIQQDIRANSTVMSDLGRLNGKGMLHLVENYQRYAQDSAFIKHLQNEYGVDMSRPLQYKKFSRPIAVNPYNQEWGYVSVLRNWDDDGPDLVELIIENPVSSCDERIWNRGEFILIWEGLVHQEIIGGIQHGRQNK